MPAQPFPQLLGALVLMAALFGVIITAGDLYRATLTSRLFDRLRAWWESQVISARGSASLRRRRQRDRYRSIYGGWDS